MLARKGSLKSSRRMISKPWVRPMNITPMHRPISWTGAFPVWDRNLSIHVKALSKASGACPDKPPTPKTPCDQGIGKHDKGQPNRQPSHREGQLGYPSSPGSVLDTHPPPATFSEPFKKLLRAAFGDGSCSSPRQLGHLATNEVPYESSSRCRLEDESASHLFGLPIFIRSTPAKSGMECDITVEEVSGCSVGMFLRVSYVCVQPHF